MYPKKREKRKKETKQALKNKQTNNAGAKKERRRKGSLTLTPQPGAQPSSKERFLFRVFKLLIAFQNGLKMRSS
jgi:hypothetical protein